MSRDRFNILLLEVSVIENHNVLVSWQVLYVEPVKVVASGSIARFVRTALICLGILSPMHGL